MSNSFFILNMTLSSITLVFLVLLFLRIRRENRESQENSTIDTNELDRLQEKLLNQMNENSRLLRSEIGDSIAKSRTEQAETINLFRAETKTAIEGQGKLVEEKLRFLQEDNNRQLEKMRATVDEKLQETLERRIGESFKQVSERLEQVYKGLGEMQTLASDVGGLKNVLSGIKTRGIFGEIQLGYILKEIFSNEQYEENFATKKGSSERVEFAIKFPGDELGSGHVYLPIDSKFPMDAYENLRAAMESGEKSAVDQAGKLLDTAIKKSAKDISDKYIDVPNTTDFAIMFLPVESLYAEVVSRGLVETLQRDYKINISGPSTMAALLNSLQMGFKTLAIEKRSGEVWQVLSAVKKAFEDFGGVLESYQKKMNTAQSDLDKLVGVRTRVINSKLKSVQSLPDMISAQRVLELDTANGRSIVLEGDLIDDEGMVDDTLGVDEDERQF